MKKPQKDSDSPATATRQDISRILREHDVTSDLTDDDLRMMEEQVAIARIFERWGRAASGGNAKAVAALHFSAKHAIMSLETAGEKNLKPFAMNEPSWPVLLMPNSRAAKLDREALLERLGVGSEPRPTSSSQHVVKTPRDIKNVAALLLRFVQLAAAAIQHGNVGRLLKEAVVVGAPEAEKSRRFGAYLEQWAHLETLQLRHLLNDLHQALELPIPPTLEVKIFSEVALRAAQLPELGENTFPDWFEQCRNVLVKIDEGFFLPGAKLREYGRSYARNHPNADGEETDGGYREGILLSLKDALRSVIDLPRTGPRASKGTSKSEK